MDNHTPIEDLELSLMLVYLFYLFYFILFDS